MRTYVVDANMLQSPELENRLRADATSTFVLPDVAILEMCKHENCQLTMKLALKAFAQRSDRVVASLSTGEVFNRELKSFMAISRATVLSESYTDFMRSLIEDLAKGDDRLDAAIQDQFGQARAKLLTRDLDATAAKNSTGELLRIMRRALTPNIVKALRKPDLGREKFLTYIQFIAEFFFQHMLTKDFNIGKNFGRRFIAHRPMYLRHFYMTARRCLIAIRNGGDISNMKPESELNHQLDQDYVLIASYFDGVISNDKQVNEGYRDLMTIIATPPNRATAVFGWLEEIGALQNGDRAFR
jgi:hypothetical protein